MLLTLDAAHDQMEQDGETRDQDDEKEEVLEEGFQIRARLTGREKEAELAGQVLHCAVC